MADPDPTPAGRPRVLEPTLLVLIIRAGLLLLCLGIAVAGSQPAAGFFIVGLAALAGISIAVPPEGLTGRALRVLESSVTAVGVVLVGGESSPLFPYLLAPAFAGGLAIGVEGALMPPGAAAVILLVGGITADRTHLLRDYMTASVEWVVLAIVAGLLATWIRRLQSREQSEDYASAYRLLSELRVVARRLSGGLDSASLAETMLDGLAPLVPFERGTVAVSTAGGRLVPLAHRGSDRTGWDIAGAQDEGPVAEAWATQQTQVQSRLLSVPGTHGSSLVLPIRVGLRTIGIVGLETQVRLAYPADTIPAAERLVTDAALGLETALLFDDVREVATAEERRRLAREIHDGIAQELAGLGYQVDALSAVARHDHNALVEPLIELRAELTRIVNELRLSIFDLRSDVDQHGGLGAALSDYVRSVGAKSDLTVHLVLDEAPARLPADTEAQLLRIAQEAITNVRKHARAENLWVSLAIDPPGALLRVEDDGVGVNRREGGRFGLDIMRERAQRLRAHLTVAPREGGGTLVEVAVANGARAATVRRPGEAPGEVLSGQDSAAR